VATEEKLHPILRGTLELVEEQGTLRTGETVLDQELAASEGAPGAVLLTNERVLFMRTSVRGDVTETVSLPIGEIAAAEASERRSPIRKRGVLMLRSDDGSETILEHIPGGAQRAVELAGEILRRRDAF
jgi:hypothetical protein